MTVLKSIVACLALANLGYFLWMHGIAQSQAVPAAASSGDTLKLASEVPPTRPAAAGAGSRGVNSGGAGDATGSPASGLPSNATRCVTLGPFKDVSAASHAASTLRGGGYDTRQRVVDGELRAGGFNSYWIDIDLKPTDRALNPADFQGEAGHINRLQVNACPSPAGAPAAAS